MSIALFSCKEDEITTFDIGAKRQVYFCWNNITQTVQGTTIAIKRTYTDSMTMTFVGVNDNSKFIQGQIPLLLMGPLSSEPIKLKFRVNKERSTAIEGEDFEIDLDSTYFKPYENKVMLKFKALRSPKLLKGKVCLAIDLVETDDYDVLEKYNNTDIWNDFQQVLSGRTFRMFYSEIMTQPFYWGSISGTDPYFGKWSITKMKLLNSLMGWEYGDWANGVAGSVGAKITTGVFGYAAYQLQQDLQKKANAGNPVIDDDGKYMQPGTKYPVDYSDYE